MKSTVQSSGEIEPDKLYTFEAARDRLNWGPGTLRTARRNGLSVRYSGRQGFVLGRDLIEYIQQHGKVER